jgi:sugar phosphate permease
MCRCEQSTLGELKVATIISSPSGARSIGARHEPSSTHLRWFVAGILLLTVLAGFFDRISIAVLFSDKGFEDAMGTGFNPTLLGLLMTSFLVAYGVSGVALGWVVDFYGPRRVLSIGLVCWGAFMGLMGAAGGFVSMMIYRTLLGVAEGPQFGVNNKVVQRWFRKSERARANAVWTIGSPLGSAIGFPLTLWLVANYGWRASFFALAAFNLIIILPLVLLFVRDQPPEAVNPNEEPASVVTAGSYRHSLAVFLRDPRFWMITFFGCGVLIYLWGVNSWLPSYLIREKRMDPAETRIYASLPFILTIVGQFAGAYLSDRVGRRAFVAGIGLMLAGVCIFLVAYMPNAHAAALMIALGGLFWGGATPTKYALLADIMPPAVLATAVGVANGIGNLVGALAPVAVGSVIGATGSFDAGFLVLVGAAVVGGAALLPLMKRY